MPKKIKVQLDNFVHPSHPKKSVIIEVYIDEDELRELIGTLKPHKDMLGHKADIPSTKMTGTVTLK